MRGDEVFDSRVGRFFRGCRRLRLRIMLFKKTDRLIKKFPARDRPLLNALAQACGQFSFGESPKRRGIYYDGAWLVKSANKIFSCGRVNGHLTADRSVNLREQGSGRLYEGHAAHVDGGGEACQVADYAAAQRYDRVASFKTSVR